MMEVANYQENEAICVAYFLAKNIEREFLVLQDTIRKESLPSNALNSSHTRSADDVFLF